MTLLSVNVNKIALLRNSRGGALPSVVDVAQNCVQAGAQGITVHPRPDARHIRYQDVYDLKEAISVELNVEGNPVQSFMDMVCDVRPAQCTLVPDDPDQLTSDHGWNLDRDGERLVAIVDQLKSRGIRVSLFMDPVAEHLAQAKDAGADRIELYTESYARAFESGDFEKALKRYVDAASAATSLGLGINAGHDLDQENLGAFIRAIPDVAEVSIGHALISEALYDGLVPTVQRYVRVLKEASR